MNKATLHYNIIKSILSSSDGYLGVATDNYKKGCAIEIWERRWSRDEKERL